MSRCPDQYFDCLHCCVGFPSLDLMRQHVLSFSDCWEYYRDYYDYHSWNNDIWIQEALRIQTETERSRENHIRKVKQNEQARRLMSRQKETYPTDSEQSSVRFDSTDSVSSVFHKLSVAFADTKLTPDEKINREYLIDCFASWSMMLSKVGSSIKLYYPSKKTEIELILHLPTQGEKYKLEVANTGVIITGLSEDAAYEMADYIRANPDAWVK